MKSTGKSSHFNLQVYHGSSVLSPKASLPTVGSSAYNSQERQKTYYFSKNSKSIKQSQQQLLFSSSNMHQDQLLPSKYQIQYNNQQQQLQQSNDNSSSIGAMPISVDQEPSQSTSQNRQQYVKSAEHDILEQQKNLFKKRHVSQIQDRLHSNTMKNMNMIQRQLQANTNMTKNRLATTNQINMPNKERSHTVNQTVRKKVIGNKTFYKLGASQRDYTGSMVGGQENYSGTDFVGDNTHNQTWTSCFEPIKLDSAGPMNYKSSGMAGAESEEVSKHNFSHAASKFLSRRKKTAVGSQVSTTERSFQDFRRPVTDTSILPDDQSLSKEINGNDTQQKAPFRFNVNPKHTNEMKDHNESAFLNEVTNMSITNQEFNSQVGAQALSPAYRSASQNDMLFARTELDGKRLGHNISDIQPSRITDDSHQILNNQLGDVSVMLSQTSAILSTNQTRAGALGSTECSKCKVWKRINQECRNLSKRLVTNDLKSVVSYLENIGSIESVKKMTPELSRTLCQLKDSLKSQYETEFTDLNTQVFKLKNKLQDTQDLAEKYKTELENFKKRYLEVINFVTASKNTTLKHGAEHAHFLQETKSQFDMTDEAKAHFAKMSKMNYSAVEVDLIDLDENIQQSKDFVKTTVKIIEDKQAQNRAGQQFHLQLDDIFQREAQLQNTAAREFMTNHFRNGTDPPVATHERGTITVQNMISQKSKVQSKAERFQENQQAERRETMNQVKIENSLLCQQKEELRQEILEAGEYAAVIEAKVAYFKDLDIVAVRKAQETIVKLATDCDNYRASFAKADALRSKLAAESKTMKVQVEGYAKEVKTTAAGYVELLLALVDLRQQITNPEIRTDSVKLDNRIYELEARPVDATIKPPGPGHPQGTNMFKRHLDDQRRAAIACVDMLKRVVAIATTDNVPILCTKQMYEEVFGKYRVQAVAQEKAKYDELIAERDRKDAERIVQKQEQEAAAAAEASKSTLVRGNALQKKGKAGAKDKKKTSSNTVVAGKTGSKLNVKALTEDSDEEDGETGKTAAKSKPSIPAGRKTQSISSKKSSISGLVKQGTKKVKALNKINSVEVEDSAGKVMENDDSDNEDQDIEVKEQHSEIKEEPHDDGTQSSDEESGKKAVSNSLLSKPCSECGNITPLQSKHGSQKGLAIQQDQIIGSERNRSTISLTSQQQPPQQNKLKPSRASKNELQESNVTSDLVEDISQSDVSAGVMAQISKQTFGLVLQEDKSSIKSAKSSQKKQNQDMEQNSSQESLKLDTMKLQPKIRQADIQINSRKSADSIAAVEAILQLDMSTDAQQDLVEEIDEYAGMNTIEREEIQEQQRLEREVRLPILQEQFDKNPRDQAVKDEYFTLLKKQFGDGKGPAINPYAPKRKLYKYDWNQKKSPHSHSPIDRAHQTFTAPMVTSFVLPGGPNKVFGFGKGKPLGETTQMKRIERQLKYNSKSIQCELLTDGPRELIIENLDRTATLFKESPDNKRQQQSYVDDPYFTSAPINAESIEQQPLLRTPVKSLAQDLNSQTSDETSFRNKEAKLSSKLNSDRKDRFVSPSTKAYEMDLERKHISSNTKAQAEMILQPLQLLSSKIVPLIKNLDGNITLQQVQVTNQSRLVNIKMNNSGSHSSVRGSRIGRVEQMSTDPKIKINEADYAEMYNVEDTERVSDVHDDADADQRRILNFNQDSVMLEIKTMQSPARYPKSQSPKTKQKKKK